MSGVDDFLASVGVTSIALDSREYSESDLENIDYEVDGCPFPLTKEQHTNTSGILKWLYAFYKDRKDNLFTCNFKMNSFVRLSGLAGTGKTMIISYFYGGGKKYFPAEVRYKEIAVCCYTWKAALVLQERGVSTAMSIHSLIYKPYEVDGKLKFYKRSADEIKGSFSLIIVDEASMVDKSMRDDIESYGIPVLYVGDFGQLPPISRFPEDATFMEKSEFKLHEINRQAKDSPILKLAYMARNGEYIKKGKYGPGIMKVSESNEEVGVELLSKMDQIICGMNKTRMALNRNMRRYLGYDPRMLPSIGESLIGTSNVLAMNVYNGQQWVCDTDDLADTPIIYGSENPMTISIPDSNERRLIPTAFPGDKLFREYPDDGNTTGLAYKIMKEREIYGMDFGYAITCHKSQGSSWNKIGIYDESMFLGRGKSGKENAKKWLYTAITRAKSKLLIVEPDF